MEKRYEDLYWGARFHLKCDDQNRYYLIGMRQKICRVFGFVVCFPLISALVMATTTWLFTGETPYVFLLAAAILFLIAFVLLQRKEHFVFKHDGVTHLLGCHLRAREKAHWPMAACDITVMPIVEHGTGCWLALTANGQRLTRNSIGNFEQTTDLAIFLNQKTGVTAYDNVTKWPEKILLQTSPEGQLRSEKPNRSTSADVQIQGSVWRLLLVFPVTFAIGLSLFAFHVFFGES